MATAAPSRIEQATVPQPTLSLAFALGQHTWQLGCTLGVAPQPRDRMIQLEMAKEYSRRAPGRRSAVACPRMPAS
jgi:hypothetical protein